MEKKVTFPRLKRKFLYEEVAAEIKKIILDGTLQPGERVPSERELCKEFGVGRPTIREALRVLANMGLIEIGVGVNGTRVREFDMSQYMEVVREELACLIKADEKTIKELWEVRKYVELGIAINAADHAVEKDFEEINKTIAKMATSIDDVEVYFPHAVEFHRQLALSTKNTIFIIVWDIFHDILIRAYKPDLNSRLPQESAKLLKVNQQLLDAIKTKNRETIAAAVVQHAEAENFFTNG